MASKHSRKKANRRSRASNARHRTATRNRRHNVRHHAHGHRTHNPRRHNRKRNAHPTRIVMIRPNRRRNARYRRHHNPFFFGANVNPTKLAQYIAGGLIGMAVNKAILPMLPAALTSNNFAASASAIVLAIAEWWLGSLVDKDFGSAVGFGALMHAGGQILNTWVPTVGAYTGISGLGRMGDFVPGRFPVPQNPISDANGGMIGGGFGMAVAYPSAYRVAA